MNPLDELHALLNLFPQPQAVITHAEHIPSAITPEPYKTLLVHHEHMTVTMERYHQGPVSVRVLQDRLEGDIYARQIVLVKHDTHQPVQFGIVRFDLSFVDPRVRAEILARQTPLGRILIQHNVLRHIDLGAVLKVTLGPALAEWLQAKENAVTYGRLATIFCDRKPAVDLLEVSAPLPLPTLKHVSE
ncbi:MAG: hypothetical protein KatS3mg114_0664 [Planctomycetaceae bacterium]|nr:MAG: hypothetical protein KatS3mg114_0664 [Planctomycetaceae bacterium]